MDDDTLKRIAREIASGLPSDCKQAWREENRFLKYRDDPVKFCADILHERFPKKIEELMYSFRFNKITIGQSSNAYGKSFAAASMAIFWYKCFENSRTYVTCAPPENNLRTILWAAISDKVRRNPKVFEEDVLTTLRLAPKSEVTLGGDPNTFIQGLTIPAAGGSEAIESRFGGKHAPYIALLIDEADSVHDSVFSAYSGWEQGGVARLAAFFNPRRKSGAAYRLIRDQKANVIKLNSLEHENVVSGKDIFPGAVTRSKVLQRIVEWTTPVVDERDIDSSCFIVPDYLVGLKYDNGNGIESLPIPAGHRRIKDPKFSYVVMGDYPGASNSALFDEAMITRCRSNWDLYAAKYGERPPELARCTLGLDVADIGPDFNVLARRYGSYVAPFDKWRGLKPFETAQRAAELHKEYNALVTRVDSIAVGCDVAPLMAREHVKAHPVDVRESPTKQPAGSQNAVFGNMRDQLYWELKLWTEDPNSMLPPDEDLLDAMRVVTYADKDGKIKILSKDKIRDALGDKSPDAMDALLLTFAPPPPVPRCRII